jgi:hypothetical protein
MANMGAVIFQVFQKAKYSAAAEIIDPFPQFTVLQPPENNSP